MMAKKFKATNMQGAALLIKLGYRQLMLGRPQPGREDDTHYALARSILNYVMRYPRQKLWLFGTRKWCLIILRDDDWKKHT